MIWFPIIWIISGRPIWNPSWFWAEVASRGGAGRFGSQGYMEGGSALDTLGVFHSMSWDRRKEGFTIVHPSHRFVLKMETQVGSICSYLKAGGRISCKTVGSFSECCGGIAWHFKSSEWIHLKMIIWFLVLELKSSEWMLGLKTLRHVELLCLARLRSRRSKDWPESMVSSIWGQTLRAVDFSQHSWWGKDSNLTLENAVWTHLICRQEKIRSSVLRCP